MSDAAAPPRDDRAWPPSAFGFSVLGALAALAGSAVLVATAETVGQAVGLLLVFLIVAGVEAACFRAAVRPWLRWEPVPMGTRLLQGALVAVTVLGFVVGPALGATVLCGVLAGAFVPNAWAIRHARINRGLVRDGEMRLDQEPTVVATPVDDEDQRTSARRTARVGPVLREALAEGRARWLAWAAATVVAVVGCAALGGSGATVRGVAVLGVCALAWVTWQMAGVWAAVREFERAATVSKRAYVVLVRDQNPRVNRPVLGVWKAEPLPTGGRLPPADAVFRCDSERRGLISSPGAVVVHEAWVGTGRRARSIPRWVAADAGVALPQGRALMGWRHLAKLIGAERLARSRPLTMRAPHPTTERTGSNVVQVITKEERETGRWVRLFAWRLAVLVLAALVFTWVG